MRPIGTAPPKYCACRSEPPLLLTFRNLDQLHIHRHRQIKRLLPWHARGGAFDRFVIAENLDARLAHSRFATQKQSHRLDTLERNVSLIPDSSQRSPQMQI